ncbi:GNAT family N-acetyltransferase [Paenibacillus sp. ACRRX]|uniref:GNAT family N-acetyltransferase n=1 Tax=unclassified Paenibacillus TaxID=185978 RepID=UPI001EF4737F|nr:MULTISPECIES: GNAT family N-acetyltransferase [unclassified Paenibacillus]MCG7408220.1 GNAT family N-acetyltransferase [Paenibacillus sp. ACRRX]MDK8181395.1 GNAT family N-acetyltransferase [Paenibacillus sp. UMB4589-SE434]
MTHYTLQKRCILDRLEVRQATEADTGAVMNLLAKTAEWLHSQGSTQWNSLLSGEDVHGTSNAIIRGDVFVFHEGGTLAAVVMLLKHPSPWDIELWGNEGHDSSIYVHRLAINRDYAGSGLGSSVMEWVENGIEFTGKHQIRLDCIEENMRLFSFYSSLGYTHRGIKNGFHLFEKSRS